jgi:hypothetical protein
VLLVVLAAVRWPKLVVASAVVAGVAIYLELILPGYDFTPAAPKSDFFTEQSGHRTLKKLTDGRFRYAASGHNFTWNTSEVFGLYDLRGAALHAPEFRQLMNEVSVESFARDTFKIQLFRDEWNLASPILDHLGVRYFALGTDDVPYGSPDREVTTPTDWVASDARHSIPVSGDVGRIDGLIVPLRAKGSCTTGAVRVRLTRDGVTTSTSRPLYDVNGNPLTFAIKSPGDAPAALSLDVSATNPRCTVETGVGADGTFAGAMLHIDEPGLDLRTAVGVPSRDLLWEMEEVRDPGRNAGLATKPSGERGRHRAGRRRRPAIGRSRPGRPRGRESHRR